MSLEPMDSELDNKFRLFLTSALILSAYVVTLFGVLLLIGFGMGMANAREAWLSVLVMALACIPLLASSYIGLRAARRKSLGLKSRIALWALSLVIGITGVLQVVYDSGDAFMLGVPLMLLAGHLGGATRRFPAPSARI